MKQTLLCLLLSFLFSNINYAQTTYAWTGNVDATTWENAGNWNVVSGPGTTYPGDGTINDKVLFEFDNFSGGVNNPLITGGAITIAQVIYDKLPGAASARVRLDLNLTVDASGLNEPAILLNSGGKVNFQNGSTFNLVSDNTVETVEITKQFDLIIRSGATVNFNGGLTAILHDHPQADMENLGTFNIASGYQSGIIFLDGTVSNEGTLDIGVTLAAGDGVYVEADKTFINSGTMNLVQSGTGGDDHALEVRGTFDNTVDGALNITGAGTVAANNLNRGIFVRNSGVFENSGLVMTDNGGVPASNMIFGVNNAVYNNNICASIILNDSKLFLVNNSMLTNNGFIKSTFTFVGVQASGNATAINNAFYSYSGGGDNIWTAGNSPNTFDNGIDVDVATSLVVDAGFSCTANLGIATPYDWFDDQANTNLVGSNDATGEINFLDDAFPQSGNYTIYNCFGDEFSFAINNLEGTCAPVPVLIVMCPLALDLQCGETIPLAATNEAEFINMGGTISGGSGNPSSYTIVSVDVLTGDVCSGIQLSRTYTITNDASGLSESCTQMIAVAATTPPTISCPADQVVTCFEDINADPALAIVNSSCGTIVSVYVKQPLITGGIPGCDGTVYTYIYKAIDDCGNVVECEQQFLIQNDAPIVTVPAGGTVECFSDILVSTNDATVVADCEGDFTINVLGPVVSGSANCPGTTYAYTYRVKDYCNRIVETERVFTIQNFSAPVITSVIETQTTTCLAGVNPNEDFITYETSCGDAGTVNIAGPQTIGTLDCNGTRYRYTYTVSDACGRTSVPVTLDYVVQNEGPVFTGCEEDQWLQFNCEDYGGEDGTIAAIQAYIASVSANSACGNDLTVFNNFNSNNINTCINNGINTITFRATDNCGRTSFCTTTYVVTDTEAPTIFEEARDHWEICNYNSPDNFDDWVDSNGGADAYDACSINNVFWSTIPSNPSFNCDGAMGVTSTTVTFVVRDNCGNTSSTTATFNAFMGGGDLDSQGDEYELVEDNSSKTNLDFTSQEGNGVIASEAFTLYQNQPNPFKEATVIGFNIPEAGAVNLGIYDVSGRLVHRQNGVFAKGFNQFDLSGVDLPSGILYYHVNTATTSDTKKMILLD